VCVISSEPPCKDENFQFTRVPEKALSDQVQGILVPNLTLGPFLTLSNRNGPNLQSYLFQDYISLNPKQLEQNYIIYLEKNLYIETINVNFKLIIRCAN